MMDHLTLSLLIMLGGTGYRALTEGEPGAPSIALKHSCGLLLEGERIEITCSAPTDAPGSTFQLHRDGKHLDSETPSANPYTAVFVSTALRAENYTCRYQKKVNGRKVTSPDSAPLRIPVHEPLLQPTMSLNEKSGLFVKGERLQITCSSPSQYLGCTFKLYRNGWCNSTETAAENASSVTFTTAILAAGDYKCIYLKTLQGRTLTSPDSDSLRITVLNPLEKPAIIPKRNSGLFLRNETAEVTCAGSSDYPGSSFDLLREGSRVAMQAAAETAYSVTFVIPHITAGRYPCRYRKPVKERTLTSPESDNMQVFVRDPLPKPVVSLKANSSAFLKGEFVHLRCSASEDYPGCTLFIYRDDLYVTSKTVRGHGYTFTFSALRISSGNFRCRYVKTLHRRRLSSQYSDPVWISVHDAPLKPSLNLDYESLVKGETATMTCKVYPLCVDCTFNLYRNGMEPETTTSREHTFAFVASESSIGAYTCSYWRNVEGRTLTSPPSKPVRLSVLEPLSKPQIFLITSSSVFVLGELMEIRCQTSYLGHKFQLFAGDTNVESQNSKGYNFTFRRLVFKGGNYSCRYYHKFKSRSFISPNSDSISIFVTDALRNPSISLNRPSGVYANRETALLACWEFDNDLDSLFTFFKDDVPLDTMPGIMDFIFFTVMLPNVSGSDQGSYHCTYEKNILGRLLRSEASESVQLTVVDLPKPVLSVESESVAKGGRLRFSCTGLDPVHAATFYLHRAGETNYSRSQTAPGTAPAVLFSIPCSEESDSGHYTCLYEMFLEGITLASTHSDSIHVAVTAGSSGFMFPFSLSIIGLILLVLLAVVLWKLLAKPSLGSVNRPLNTPGVEDIDKTSDSAAARKSVSWDENKQPSSYESLEF